MLIIKSLKIIAFLLSFTLLFITVSYAMRSGIHFPNIRYGMQPADTLDVVYVGGSSCFTFWAPMEAYARHGFTSYNFAHNAMQAQVEKYCIMEALKSQSPELLIVDVRAFEYGDEAVKPENGSGGGGEDV